jgi:hypothetical protein
MMFSVGDQRILDCHVAWVHGYLSTEELYQEIWANTSEDQQSTAIVDCARALGTAAATRMDRLVMEAFTR